MPSTYRKFGFERDLESRWTAKPHSGSFEKKAVHYLNAAELRGVGGKAKEWMMENTTTFKAYCVGIRMEHIEQDIDKINETVQESKRILSELVNEVVALSENLSPMLEKKTSEIRSLRMSLVNELNQSLAALRDVRRFFLDSDYRTEMDRLKEFVLVCKEIQALKTSGVFDAVCDSAVRLALREEKNEG